MNHLTVEQIVKKLDLKPHPKGGFYRETYRAGGKFSNKDYKERDYSTNIYFLLVPDSFSALHKIDADETWHFYSGGPITVVELTPEGAKKTIIGANIEKGEVPQYVVPAGTWFGSYLNDGGKYALVGCTVSPAFEFKDFEMGNKAELLKLFPNAKDEIIRLTR